MAFALAAAPLVVATGRRVAARDRRLAFDALVAELRGARARPLPRWLRDPDRLASAVERWLPLTPPRAYGPCLRRALLLLDLWSRCGLEPTLHLGFAPGAPERGGHAWLTGTTPGGRRLEASGPNGYVALFEL